MHSSRLYFNNIGSICTDSLRHGNGLSALLLLIRAAKKGTDVSRLTGCISIIVSTSKEPVCPRVELIVKIIIILLIIFLGFIKSKPC